MQLRDQLQATLSGAYTIERELGGGGMSRVFVAEEQRLGRKVVVKVLSPELAAGINADRFEREIKLAASLQQANIVPVLTAGDTNGLPYFTMPFVEGESLRVRLAKQPSLGTTDILRILGDVARALQYAHDRGIVHRDIKPDNVLLSGGTAVVTDFGIAKALSAAKESDGAPATGALTMMGTSIGTPMYMAPEQAAGDPDIDHRADIYAFGCMAYELLTGHPPFHGKTPQRILAAQMGEAPAAIGDLRPDLPVGLRDLVMQCLAKDPNGRPQFATEIVRALDAVTSGSGVQAMPASLLDGPAAFRKALFIYVACAVGVVVVAKAATIVIGLPDWVVPSAIFVMALGLPVILFTGYVQSVSRRTMLRTPTLTPGGGTMGPGTMASIAMRASPHLSWKRATRGGIFAFAAFVLLVIGFMVTRAMGIGPAASLFAKGVMKTEDKVLVADFDAPATDSSLGSVVSEGVRSNLSQSKALTIVPGSEIAAALARAKRPSSTRVDYDVAKELAQREGYKIIVDGRITPVGAGGFIVTARLLTADTGDPLASFREVAGDATGIIPAIDKLTRDLRSKVGESLKSVRAAPTLEHATTASLPALRKYTEGFRANSWEQNYAKAIPLLEEAIKLDTTFAQAYRAAATAYANAGLNPKRASDLRDLAFKYREHLPESDRYIIEGTYYNSGAHADRVKALQVYRKAIEADSTNYPAYNSVALIENGMRHYAAAESLYRMGRKGNPNILFFTTNLVANLLSQGRVQEAAQLWNEHEKAQPNSPLLLRWSLIVNAYGIDSAQKACRQAVKNPGNLQGRTNAMICDMSLSLTRGQMQAAFAGIRAVLANDSARGVASQGFDATVRLNEADAAAWFENRKADAAKIVDDVVAKYPPDSKGPSAPAAGVIQAYALAGRPDKARAIMDRWLASMDTAETRLSIQAIHAARARIAGAEGKYDEAVRELFKSDSLSDGLPSVCNGCIYPELGFLYDLAGRDGDAIATFEKYLATPYAYKWDTHDPIYLAPIYKRLGELYEARGQPAKAIDYFSKFIDLWKNADPVLQPKVAEARTRVARLQKAEGRAR